MKLSTKILTVALLAVVAIVPASAQFRFGVKAGVVVNKLHFSSDIIDDVANTDNRAGFTGGVMAEVGLPLTGLCIDGSLLYAHRSGKITGADGEVFKRDYIDIPVNIKYKLGIVGLEQVFAPFIFTGPDFAFLVSDKDGDLLKNKTFNASWNVGLGVELVKHLQIAATYGIGLSKAVDKTIGTTSAEVNGKDRYWTVTAAYLF